MRPTLRQLQYLVAVAEAGKFHEAAKALNVSQPSLSAQIATDSDKRPEPATTFSTTISRRLRHRSTRITTNCMCIPRTSQKTSVSCNGSARC